MKYYDKFEGIKQSDSYDQQTALSLAIACDLAYEKRSKVKATLPSWGYQLTGYVNVQKKPDIDTQCFVMENDENIVVVFRGSNSIEDWLANFQAVSNPGPLKNTKAHEGFQDALYPAVIQLTKLVDLANDGSKKLWLTGHSLGGALASLYAGMLIENGYAVYGIYTYASPRPANGKFEDKLNAKVIGPHYRVVNHGDIVPHVPPEPFYSHPGKRVILKQLSIDNSEASWFEQRVDALKVFVKNTSNLLDIADNHRLSADRESYIPRLLAYLKQ